MNNMSDERRLSIEEEVSARGEEERVRLILFRLEREWHALRAEEIREVVQRANITRVPNSPTSVVGIMNLRGRILLVVDLDSLLGLPPQPKERPRPQVVILNLPDPELDVGFLVDQVAQMREIPMGQLRDLSTAESGEGRGAFIRGALYHEGLLIHVLDPAPMISALVPEMEEAVG
ncbi:MAG: chemotaxis protein CheW [candidate division NC10 bacterium]|nr:chemotaxis protein CheW [candidate division NC10 bacterium]